MEGPIVTIKQGQLRGLMDIDLFGDSFYKFLGIPYAKPPLGEFRFKAPQPAESWTGIRDATIEGNACLAFQLFDSKVTGSEDCLYLNVFTKKLPTAGLSPKPVMVFFHGSGFTTSSGTEKFQGGGHLVSEDVVLVVLNYRLGVFGFLSSDDLSLDIPGNAGLKDQTHALRWVQENISSFNGDPNNVTIFGTSAGGASAQFQVLSPSAKGLFHKASIQSGSAINPWAWGQKNMIQIAEKLGKKVSNDNDALDVILSVSATELCNTCLTIKDQLADSSKRRPFGPVIEKPNPTAFLTENPTDLLKSGRFNQVPQIIGVASNEGAGFSLMQKDLLLIENPAKMGVLWNLGVEENSQKFSEIEAKINELYFKNGNNAEAIEKLISDACFMVGVVESAKLAAKTSQSPVYLYVFNYKISASDDALRFLGVDRVYEGAPHGGEQPMLFSSTLFDNFSNKDPKALEEKATAVKEVTKIWADFARAGRPHALWEPISNELKYFDINEESKLKVNPFEERFSIWEEIFKEFPSFVARFQETPK